LTGCNVNRAAGGKVGGGQGQDDFPVSLQHGAGTRRCETAGRKGKHGGGQQADQSVEDPVAPF